jgi:hypothetical protein
MLRLNTLAPNGVHAVSTVSTSMPHYEDWLYYMMSQENAELWIFFYTIDSTDIFEKEWDFNEYAFSPAT